MSKVAEKVLRPFHETIVNDILKATNEELVFIASQLKKSIVPTNHDQIIEAWNMRRKAMCWGDDLDLGVSASLLQQKQTAEAKAKQDKPGIELGNLQEQMEIFLALSHNHGLTNSLVSWHIRLREQLQNLHRLISQALGK